MTPVSGNDNTIACITNIQIFIYFFNSDYFQLISFQKGKRKMEIFIMGKLNLTLKENDFFFFFELIRKNK